MSQRVQDVAGAASATTETAAEQAREVASTAAQEVRQVGDTARHEVGEVTQQAVEQARSLVQDAKAQAREQVQAQTTQLVDALRRFGEDVQGLAQGRAPQSSALQGYLTDAGGKVEDLAQQLRTRGYEGALDDVQRFARRRPGAFLGGAAIAGFFIGRFLRGAKAADESNGANGQLAAGQMAQTTPGIASMTTPGIPATAPMPPAQPLAGRPTAVGDPTVPLPQPGPSQVL